MSSVPQARTFSVSGQAIANLPITLFTVPAGQVWRIWDAYVQMNMQAQAIAAQSTLDLILDIIGGDILVACSITLLNQNSGENAYAELDQGARSIAPGSQIRLRTAFGLPANTVARATGGILISQT